MKKAIQECVEHIHIALYYYIDHEHNNHIHFYQMDGSIPIRDMYNIILQITAHWESERESFTVIFFLTTIYVIILG